VCKVVSSLSASEAVPGFDIKVALKEFTITDRDDSNRMASITNVSLMNQFLSRHYIKRHYIVGLGQYSYYWYTIDTEINRYIYHALLLHLEV